MTLIDDDLDKTHFHLTVWNIFLSTTSAFDAIITTKLHNGSMGGISITERETVIFRGDIKAADASRDECLRGGWNFAFKFNDVSGVPHRRMYLESGNDIGF